LRPADAKWPGNFIYGKSKNMIDEFFALIDKLFPESGGVQWRRVVSILALAFLVVCGVAAFEEMTGHFRLARMERTAKLIHSLEQCKELLPAGGGEEGIENAVKVIPKAFVSVTMELDMLLDPSHHLVSLPSWLLRFAAALIPWAIIFAVFSTSPGGTNVFRIIFATAILCAVVGVFLPEVSILVNYFVYPFGMAIFLNLAIAAAYAMRRK